MKTVLLQHQPPPGNRTPRKQGHSPSSTQRFGRGRVTGLALIALLTLGLGYLHFVGGSASVSVPSGAHAGQLTLKQCTYANELADCGTLVVRGEPAQPAVASDRASDHARPGANIPSRYTDLPAPGRSRRHEHGLPRREPLHRST